jgi:hypothetical protein
MRCREVLTAAALLIMAGGLATANIWIGAARSTIPLQLDAVVSDKEVRHEKHPPKDDVCLLNLGPYGTIHADRDVFDRVAMNDRLRKTRWSRLLFVNEKPLELKFSADASGMLRAMPLALLISLVTAVWACRIRGWVST